MEGVGTAGFPRPLQVQAIQSFAEEGFWDALCSLKLDVLGTDDSLIPITIGFPTPSLLLFACRIHDLGHKVIADPLHFCAPIPALPSNPNPACLLTCSDPSATDLVGSFVGLGS